MKIKCPHCGANNQDVTEKDRCWQCDTVLGAPVIAAEPTSPTASAEQKPPTAPRPTQVQKQVEPTPPTSRPTAPTSQSRFPVAPVVIGVVLLLIVLAIVFFIMKK